MHDDRLKGLSLHDEMEKVSLNFKSFLMFAFKLKLIYHKDGTGGWRQRIFFLWQLVEKKLQRIESNRGVEYTGTFKKRNKTRGEVWGKGWGRKKGIYLCLTNINFRKMQFNFLILYTHIHILTHTFSLSLCPLVSLSLSQSLSLSNRHTNIDNFHLVSESKTTYSATHTTPWSFL